MATNDTEDLSNLSDDEIEARQRAEDGEAPDTNPKAGDETDDAATAAAQAQAQADADAAAAAAAEDKSKPATTDADAAAAQAAGADAAKEGKVEGVQSKDGSRVLPYGALQAARRDARRAESRAERAERELQEAQQLIADMKAGKTPEAGMPTEAEVAEMEANFPEQGKVMRALFDRAQELEKKVPKAEVTDDPTDDPVQDAIDQVPLLLQWQHDDAQKFSRAVEHDAVLLKSPKWAGKPAVERFAEATRRTADEYDVPYPEPDSKAKPSTTTAATAASVDPAEKARQAQRKPPETLSDFKGGSIADHNSVDVKSASPRALLSRMENMTDAEIDAHLAKYG